MTHEQRLAELAILFTHRGEGWIHSIGQLTPADHRRLKWGIKHRLVLCERRPWPGPIIGTCIKTSYVWRDYLQRCAEGEGGRACLAVQGYADSATAYYFAREAAHYARLILRLDQGEE